MGAGYTRTAVETAKSEGLKRDAGFVAAGAVGIKARRFRVESHVSGLMTMPVASLGEKKVDFCGISSPAVQTSLSSFIVVG